MALPVRRRDAAPQPVRRWDPRRELEDLRDRLAQIVHRADGDGSAPFTPRVDIEETEDAWIVEADLPGVTAEDVDVDVRGTELAISGEIKERRREGVLRRRSRRTGAFECRISLPGEADTEHVDAGLRDGVLTVRVPKPEHARPHRIDVKAA
jgi:HSP20 family protein